MCLCVCIKFIGQSLWVSVFLNNEASLEIFPELSSLEKCLAKVKCQDGGWKEEGSQGGPP